MPENLKRVAASWASSIIVVSDCSRYIPDLFLQTQRGLALCPQVAVPDIHNYMPPPSELSCMWCYSLYIICACQRAYRLSSLLFAVSWVPAIRRCPDEADAQALRAAVLLDEMKRPPGRKVQVGLSSADP